jgi:HSP90 family molecular chaperone
VDQLKRQEEAFGKERDSFNELMQSLSEKAIRGEEELASVKADFARRKDDLEAQMIRLMENQAQESSQGGSPISPLC